MARQRRDMEQRGHGLTVSSSPKHGPLAATSTPHRRSDATTPHAAELAFGGSPQLSNPGPAQWDLDGPGEPAEPDRTGYQRLPQQDEAPNARRQPGRSNEAGTSEEITVTVLDSSSTYGDDVETKPIKWEQFDFGDIQILPPEILGWIMLRRSGLPASSRLSVLTAIKNKL